MTPNIAMGTLRRAVVKSTLALVAALSTTLLALSSDRGEAQERYPSRPVKIVVPYPAGGPSDAVARLLASKLGGAFEATFLVENMPGAAGSLGARAVGRAAPDGHTLLLMTQDFLVQPLIKASTPYDASGGFAPVSLVAQAPEAIFVHPSVPAGTVGELIALLKANPGKYSYATPGVGTTPHLAGERLFKVTHRLDVAHVPFPGGPPAVTATLGGHTQILLITVGSVAANVRDGSLRALAVASPKRWPGFPDVPTLAESGLPEHDAEFILGVMAPTGTPGPIVDALSREIAKALADEELKSRFETLGLQPVGSTPTEFAAKLDATTSSWSKVVQATGVKIN
jgi:tripartite-type tricarboxylate transporter receptor subunit TctC